jgi:hypothetical protein
MSTTAHAIIVLGNTDSVNLSEVFAPGSDHLVWIHDKVFNFESYSSSQFHVQDFTLTGFISDAVNQYGLRNVGFDITGPFGDGSPGDGVVHEMNLQYNVAVRPEFYQRGIRLCDARLTFNGRSSGDGSFARVDESILDLDRNVLLGTLSVYDLAGPPPMRQDTDGADYCVLYNSPGYRAFEVNKDFKFFAAHPNDTATASWVRQEFSQCPTPGAIATLGLAGLIAGRRRR